MAYKAWCHLVWQDLGYHSTHPVSAHMLIQPPTGRAGAGTSGISWVPVISPPTQPLQEEEDKGNLGPARPPPGCRRATRVTAAERQAHPLLDFREHLALLCFPAEDTKAQSVTLTCKVLRSVKKYLPESQLCACSLPPQTRASDRQTVLTNIQPHRCPGPCQCGCQLLPC